MLRNRILIALAVCSSAPLVAQARGFGSGCATFLPSEPSMATSVQTVSGSKFDLEIDAVAKSTPFLLVFGVSNTKWNSISLPFDTSNIGLPGCFLNVSYDKVFGLASDASGKFKLPVATTGLPPGLRLYTQLVVPEPSGSRIATSKGYELTLWPKIKPFNVVAIPDTQNYVYYGPYALNFNAMTQWIVNNKTSKNAVFVSHVGDIVNDGAMLTNNNRDQWVRADTAMSILDGDLKTNPDGLIPYSACIGNRDYDAVSVKSAYAQYLKYFGPQRTSGRKWFGGTGPDGLSSYQVFDASGQKYLHVALEWRPRDAAIAWARSVLAAHPELPTILTTHQYLLGATSLDDAGQTPNSGGDNGGSGILHKLVEPFPQIVLVICGHNFGSGGVHVGRTTITGRTVFEILADYSFDPNGGNGWMNLIEFQPDTGRIVSACFSPTYQQGTTPGLDRRFYAANNAIFSIDVNDQRRLLETTVTRRFVSGVDFGFGAYTGATDTFVSSASSSSAFGTATDVHANHPTSDEQQGLIKFGNLFGTAAGQIPTNKPIKQAILTLTTEGSGATSSTNSSLYRLLVPFTESTTWTSLKGGVQVGVETASAPVASTGTLVSTEGTRSFDVTASLRAWQAGATNHGWAIFNKGTDNWSFRSREWGTVAERPMLTIVYEK